jgi:hypothetical protein
MNMYARSHTPEAAKRAGRVYSRFRELASKGLVQIKPNELRLDFHERSRQQIRCDALKGYRFNFERE